MAFTFRPECCSESQRNGVQLQTGIAFTFDRIPQSVTQVASDEHRRLKSPGQDRSVKGDHMAKTVSCRDVGMDCDFVAKGETDEDIMQQAAEHARTAHNMTEIPPEVADKVRGAIRDEAA